MSESRAKKERKTQVQEKVVVKKKDPSSIIINIIIVLVVIAVAGCGVWAAYDKISANIAANTEAGDTQNTTPQTVAIMAQEEGLSVEELLAKCGLEDSGITGESLSTELLEIMTIENFAKFEDTDVEEFKKQFGIEALANDTLWSEAQNSVPMGKIAENEYGMSFEEFAAQAGLPEGITAEMTQGEAVEFIQSIQTTEE